MKLQKISQKVYDRAVELETQKILANKILLSLSEKFQYVLLAGGAPRNWAYNKLANDLDFYVLRHRTGKKYQEKIDNQIQETLKELPFNFGENKAKKLKHSNPYGDFILNGLYDFSVDRQNCQLMIINDEIRNPVYSIKSFSERIFKTYDFGLCKTSMDVNGHYYNDPMFDIDYQNNTFTANVKEFKRNNEAGLNKLIERFQKMESYFPDHKMRII